jgi:hypothetical protein
MSSDLGDYSNSAPGYWTCAHPNCHKKADPAILDHDCCNRCSAARNRGCYEASIASYDGPGTFPHRYAANVYGNCMTCGEAESGHQWGRH